MFKMNNQTYYWQPFEKGFYIAFNNLDDFIGIDFNIAYIPSAKCFQTMLHIGILAIALGWEF
jgi:hypothetical protein